MPGKRRPWRLLAFLAVALVVAAVGVLQFMDPKWQTAAIVALVLAGLCFVGARVGTIRDDRYE